MLGVAPSQVKVLGDATPQHGRSLVQISNVRRSAGDILAWYKSSAVMIRFTTRFYLFPAAGPTVDSEVLVG